MVILPSFLIRYLKTEIREIKEKENQKRKEKKRKEKKGKEKENIEKGRF